jgi:small subunit ribosomal protein S5
VAEPENIDGGGGEQQQPPRTGGEQQQPPRTGGEQQQQQQQHRGRGGPRGRRGRPGDSPEMNFGSEGQELVEKVVFINRSAKVVKGGRRFNFSALIVVGDKRGKVGVGLGKAGEVADAIRKGGEMARGAMVGVSLKDATIPHEVFSHYGGAKVLLRPASPGTGIIAGKTVRAVLESAGVKDILSKSLGSKNAANVVKATLSALLSLRLREDIYRGRGIEIKKPKPAPAAVPPGGASAQPPQEPPTASGSAPV